MLKKRKLRAALGLGGKAQKTYAQKLSGRKQSRAALGLGAKPTTLRKRSFKQTANRLFAFLGYRYTAKAIAKYQSYANRYRKSRRLIRLIRDINANTFMIKNHLIKTDTNGNNPFSCTCEDFTQITSTDFRVWKGSKAGPFNPCKHMMAVRDRKWKCINGVCKYHAKGTFLTEAECKAVCNPTPSYTVTVSLGWQNGGDYDLYGKVVGGAVTFYGARSNDGLTLNGDAFPNCRAGAISPPEIISGTFIEIKTFQFWYNIYARCAPEIIANQSIVVTNTGGTNLLVNNSPISNGESFTLNTIAYAGYGTNSQTGFNSGTTIAVTIA